MSRSTLRDHIAELEFELKVPLIERTNQGIKLTAYGKRFLEQAEVLCSYADEIVKGFEELKNNYLSINISYSTLLWLRTLILRARMNVIEQHPEKIIEITTSACPLATSEALVQGMSDLAVIRADYGTTPENLAESFEGLVVHKLATSRILLFTSIDNPLALIDEPTVADLAGQTLMVTNDIYEAYQAHADSFDVFGMDLRTAAFSDYTEYYMADYSHCIGTVPEAVMDAQGVTTRIDCKVLDVKGLDLKSDFYCACTKEFLENPTAALFFDELSRLVDEAAESSK